MYQIAVRRCLLTAVFVGFSEHLGAHLIPTGGDGARLSAHRLPLARAARCLLPETDRRAAYTTVRPHGLMRNRANRLAVI